MGAVEVEFEDGRGSGDVDSTAFFNSMFSDAAYPKFKAHFNACSDADIKAKIFELANLDDELWDDAEGARAWLTDYENDASGLNPICEYV